MDLVLERYQSNCFRLFFKSVLDCFVSWLSLFKAGSSSEEVTECKKIPFTLFRRGAGLDRDPRMRGKRETIPNAALSPPE